MCLIALAWNAHRRFPLVLIANRDEFHERPTAPLAPWTDAPDVLGGRDLREGGGWLALHRDQRRLAAVTNVRETPPITAPLSRGQLVREYVIGEDCAAAFAEMRRVDGNDYGGFNLLLWDGEELVVATNRLKPRWETVATGLHGISNGAFDESWPKTRCVVASLEGWLASIAEDSTAAPDIEPLFTALADERRPADSDLPDTGIGIERERLLAAPFIRLPGYGTRASSVILIDRDGRALFVERSFDENGEPGEERRVETRYAG